MGTEAAWIPLLLSAVGTGASIYNQRQTAKKQDNQLASQIRMQQAEQQKANARTSQLINQQAQQTDEPQKQAAQMAFRQQLAANQAQASSPLKNVGAASQAYQKSGANAAQGISSYGQTQGDLLGSIMAPTQQRLDNIKNLDNYQVDLGNIGRELQGNNYLSNMKLQSIHENPWLSAASGLLGSAGGAMSQGNNYNQMMNFLQGQTKTKSPYYYTGDDNADYLGGAT